MVSRNSAHSFKYLNSGWFFKILYIVEIAYIDDGGAMCKSGYIFFTSKVIPLSENLLFSISKFCFSRQNDFAD